MKIRIECEIPDDIADRDDDTGVTTEGFDQIMDALMQVGATDIEIEGIE